MSFFALWAIGIGSVFGAVGASSMFWTERAKKLLEKQAHMPKGKKRTRRKKLAAAAREKLANREAVKDVFTLIGWALVIVGSAFAIWGAWPEPQ